MSRPLRIEFNDAWYHVMNRGSGRQPVFKTDDQRDYFLSLLADTHERYNADWHAYCLMETHYHLMVRTPEGNLQRIMRHINGVYTQYFNRSEQTDGALFRGRYKAILVDADTYWLQLSRYIHRNPLAAGLVNGLPEYRWSSYRAYTGLEPTPTWLSVTYILKALGSAGTYASFVERGVDNDLADFYSGDQQSPVLGDATFRDQLLKGMSPTIDQPELKRARHVPSAAEIVRVTARHFDCREATLWCSTRGQGVTSAARSIAMHLCHEAGGMTLSQIAPAFGLANYASAGSSIRNMRMKIRDDQSLSNIVDAIKLDLTP